ncbi:hypothetical protein [Prevotella koreensis]|uniref:hypothetical protein n=1 Tax=Prevotella koreensis TaxID=2490854 RepID=UPI0028EFD9FF|nr:hypothetical protein [Prevotella koreensis]
MQNKFLFYFRQKEFFRQKDRKVVGTERHKCWGQKDKKGFGIKTQRSEERMTKKRLNGNYMIFVSKTKRAKLQSKMGEIAEQIRRNWFANRTKLREGMNGK